MASLAVLVVRSIYPVPLVTNDTWPESSVALDPPADEFVRDAVTPAGLRHRYAAHPSGH